MKKDSQKKLSQELRAFFIKKEYPVPFGLLDNAYVDVLPESHKKILADAFCRAWMYRQSKLGKVELFFNAFERGPFYKKYHYESYLYKVMCKFEELGFIKRRDPESEEYLIKADKFIEQRHYENIVEKESESR